MHEGFIFMWSNLFIFPCVVSPVLACMRSPPYPTAGRIASAPVSVPTSATYFLCCWSVFLSVWLRVSEKKGMGWADAQECRLPGVSEFYAKRFGCPSFNLFPCNLHFVAAVWMRSIIFTALGSLLVFQAAHPPFVHTIFLLVRTIELMSRPLESTPDHLGWHSGNSQTLLALTVWLIPTTSAENTFHWFNSPRKACFLYWGKEGESLWTS